VAEKKLPDYKGKSVLLARELLECKNKNCQLCGHCLGLIRAVLGLQEKNNWPNHRMRDDTIKNWKDDHDGDKLLG
jgi:hypothetical protein